VSRAPAAALLVDMDGVLRRWDRAYDARIEQRYGLPPGALLATAMAPERVRPVLLGEVGHAAWMAGVGEALGAPEAVAEWETYRGEVDPDVLGLVREVRAAGIPVGLVTNATDRLDADLVALGLTDELDAVINSSVVGVAKPAPEYFSLACAAVRVPPADCLVVDDSDRVVRGARAAGLLAHRWTGPVDLPYLRAALGRRASSGHCSDLSGRPR
jgi:putative hydrolase of the HAD superfamily